MIEEPQLTRMVDGAAFVLDAPTTVPCLWGRGNEVIWSHGESFMLAGPPGVGKTTLIGQVARARLGLEDFVLGYRVEATASRLLYLAMDRPAQIARSLRRHFHEDERPALAERLVVWRGPPPGDLAGLASRNAARPRATRRSRHRRHRLTQGCRAWTTDDEVGAAYNRARQLALREGVQLVELHHVVKRGASGTQPTTLADVYGSTWLAAGAGSVVLLWGAAGDPVVEWRHLKQPAGEVGPMQLVHDHDAGRSDVWKGTDLVKIAVASGTHGLTVRAAAVALFQTDKPTAAEHMKAARRLDALVRDGKLIPGEAAHKPTGGKAEKVYFAAARDEPQSNHGAITRSRADNDNHGSNEQSRTGPPLKGAVQLPVEPELVAPICIDCGWRVDSVGHETNCEVVA